MESNESKYSDEVAAEIRAILARRAHSQKSLAETSGIPPRTLWRKLNGRTTLTVGDIATIAAALGMPVSELARRAEQQNEVGAA